MQRFHIDARLGRRRFAVALEHILHTVQKLFLPLPDLVGMHVKSLRQFTQGLLAANRAKGNFRLERRCVITPGSSGHYGSPVVGNHADDRPKSHL